MVLQFKRFNIMSSFLLSVQSRFTPTLPLLLLLLYDKVYSFTVHTNIFLIYLLYTVFVFDEFRYETEVVKFKPQLKKII